MALTFEPLEIAIDVTVPGACAMSRLPASMARNTLTPPSSATVFTSMPFFLKIPRSCATITGKCTTFGGVVGMPTVSVVCAAPTPGNAITPAASAASIRQVLRIMVLPGILGLYGLLRRPRSRIAIFSPDCDFAPLQG